MTGIQMRSQNRWPSLAFDVGGLNNLASPFFAAGFYYKTFMWPKAAWKKIYEPVIRAAAGLGVAPSEPDPDHYSNHFAHCDVLVIGGGAAGLSAALAAAHAGSQVILCDEQPETGGAFHHETDATDRRPARLGLGAGGHGRASRDGQCAVADAHHRLRIPGAEPCWSCRAGDRAPGQSRSESLPRERLWQVRAKQVVIATGAIERHMVFAEQ
jgi:sarcosine oxidase subunit alpha